jgi:hypothetical protein
MDAPKDRNGSQALADGNLHPAKHAETNTMQDRTASLSSNPLSLSKVDENSPDGF